MCVFFLAGRLMLELIRLYCLLVVLWRWLLYLSINTEKLIIDLPFQLHKERVLKNSIDLKLNDKVDVCKIFPAILITADILCVAQSAVMGL